VLVLAAARRTDAEAEAGEAWPKEWEDKAVQKATHYRTGERTQRLLLAVLLFLCAAPACADPLVPGDIIMGDGNADALWGVNPLTGAQTRLATLPAPTGIVVAPNGDVLVVDSTEAAIYRYDPVTFQRTVVSSGPNLATAEGLAREANGSLVFPSDLVTGGSPGIVRVNPVTGQQSIVSGGGGFIDLRGIAVRPDGQIVVGDGNADALWGVDPLTGAQIRLATLPAPAGVVIDANGDILVGDSTDLTIYRFDANTLARTVVSSGGDLAAIASSGLALEQDGSILVATLLAGGTPGIVRVNPVTGQQSIVSSGGDFIDPRGIAVFSASVPEPGSLLLGTIGILSLLAYRWRHLL
jgi:streptogramin lyase